MKKILMSLLTIAIVGALITGGTMAFFSDTETATRNVFTAGTIDISIDPADGQNVVTLEGVLDLKPCQTGYTSTFIHNDGTNPADIWKHIANVENRENEKTDAEQKYYTDYPDSRNWLLSNWIHYDLLASPLVVTEGQAGYDGVLFDFTKEYEGYFGWQPLGIAKVYHDDWTEFIIEMPRALGEAPDNFDLVFDTNCDDDPDWLVHWYFDETGADKPGWPGTTHWAYKNRDYPSGHWLGWGDYQALPGWISATPDLAPCKQFHIFVDNDVLGTRYRFALQAPLSDQGYPPSWSGNVAVIHFPVGVADMWTDSSDYEEELVGEDHVVISEDMGYMLTGSNHHDGVESYFNYLGEIAPCEYLFVKQSYHLDSSVENWGQSDQVRFDMEFMALQMEGEPIPEPQRIGKPG